jgi:hypothetical protein
LLVGRSDRYIRILVAANAVLVTISLVASEGNAILGSSYFATGTAGTLTVELYGSELYVSLLNRSNVT